MGSHARRRQRALSALLTIAGLVVIAGMLMATVHADSKFMAGTPEAEDALNFDPYDVDACAVEMDMDAAMAADPEMPDDPPPLFPFPGGGGSPPTGDGYLTPTQLFIPFRPPPASPVR